MLWDWISIYRRRYGNSDESSPMPKLSVLILCKNEEDRIARCIESVAWADEVLVVDSHSTDGSVGIAEDCGARVLPHDFVNYAEQYNWGIEQASHPWIFIVDADEVASPELATSIKEVLRADAPPHNVYMVRRDAYFMGRLMRSSAWSGEWLPRFFRRGALTYGSAVHSTIDYDRGATGSLSGIMYHYTYRNMEHCLAKLNFNSTLAAQGYYEAGKRVSLFFILANSGWRLFHNYFFRRDVLDGVPGVISSFIAAWYNFVKYAKVWEKERTSESERRS